MQLKGRLGQLVAPGVERQARQAPGGEQAHHAHESGGGARGPRQDRILGETGHDLGGEHEDGGGHGDQAPAHPPNPDLAGVQGP